MEDVKGAFSPVIESVGGLPILFDEGGTERQVGWYRYANGTKQPVYEKCLTGTFAEVTEQGVESSVIVSIGSTIKSYVDSCIYILTYDNTIFYKVFQKDVSNNVEGYLRQIIIPIILHQMKLKKMLL